MHAGMIGRAKSSIQRLRQDMYYRVRIPSHGSPPAAPSGASASETNKVTATVLWTDNSTNETSFNVYRSVDAAAYAVVGTASANAVSYTDTTLTAGSTYQYKISAVNGAGESALTSATTIFTSVYHYGFPTFGVSEPNVVAQWLFDEASGNIVDEVAGDSLAPAGDVTYSIAATGAFAGISPGISTAAHSYNRFVKDPDSTLQIGTSNYTMEWWELSFTAASTEPVAYLNDASNHGMRIYHLVNVTQQLQVILSATDATTVTSTIVTASLVAATLQKYRLVFTRSANLEVFLDGVSQGTNSIATLSGKTIPCTVTRLMNDSSENNSLPTSLYEMRFSSNLTNNSGGPGGG